MTVTLPNDAKTNKSEFLLTLKPTISFNHSDFKDYLFLIDKLGDEYKIITTLISGTDPLSYLNNHQYYASGSFTGQNKDDVQKFIYGSMIPVRVSVTG